MNIDLKKYSLEFFSKYKNTSNDLYDFETDALYFVQDNFRYKDRVEADTLVMILEDNFSFIKFKNKQNDKRYFIITNKGRDYLNNI